MKWNKQKSKIVSRILRTIALASFLLFQISLANAKGTIIYQPMGPGELTFTVDSAITFNPVVASPTGTPRTSNVKYFYTMEIEDLDALQGVCLYVNSTNLTGVTYPSKIIAVTNLYLYVKSIKLSGNITTIPTNYFNPAKALLLTDQIVMATNAGVSETGTYTFDAQMQLAIPAYQSGQNYTGTLTFTISPGRC